MFVQVQSVLGYVWLHMVVCWWWHGARNMIVGERGGPLCLLMGPTPETHISCINTIWKVKEKTIARQSESESINASYSN